MKSVTAKNALCAFQTNGGRDISALLNGARQHLMGTF